MLDTGDVEEDFAVTMDEWINICYGVNIDTPDFIQNTDWGLFRIRFNSEDGTIDLTEISTGHA